MKKTTFGRTKDNQEIFKFIFTSTSGIEVHVLNYGATIQKILVPQKNGKPIDIVLGFDNLTDYENPHPYFGSIIGRNANRLKGGKIRLGDKKIQISQNEGRNQLHGGFEGFGKKVWDFAQNGDKLHLFYQSPHGDEGYPGNLDVEVVFEWRGDTFAINHKAKTDQTTVVNLTRHEYFNLAQGENILDHTLYVNADTYLPIDSEELPTGKIMPVTGTVMELDGRLSLGEKLKDLTGGYNHNYILKKRKMTDPAAILLSPKGTLKMSLFCTQPGLQFFSADNIGDWMGKYGAIVPHNPALCLEPQHFPDVFSHNAFPSTVLRPGEVYEHEIGYQFESL